MVITGTAAKAADRYAIDVLGIPSLDLMEAASSHAAQFIIENCPAQVLIICGTGNNGADGVCIGRMLLEHGFDPLVIVAGNIWKGTWEFYRQLSDYRRINGRLMPAGMSEGEAGIVLPDADILVDAVFGIGLKREVQGTYRELIEKMNQHPAKKISVDVPSGINADTGEEMGAAFRSDITFTFGKNKTGLVTGAGISAAGDVRVCDIGIPEEAYTRGGKK